MNRFKVGDNVYLKELAIDKLDSPGIVIGTYTTDGVPRCEIRQESGELLNCDEKDLYSEEEYMISSDKEDIYDKSPKDILVPFKHSVRLVNGREYLFVGDKFARYENYVLLDENYSSDLRTHNEEANHLNVAAIKEIDWKQTKFLNNEFKGNYIWTRVKYDNHLCNKKHDAEIAQTNEMKAEIEKMKSTLEQLELKYRNLEAYKMKYTSKCGCGKEARYIQVDKNGNEIGSCNKHFSCPDYNELKSTYEELFNDFKLLMKSTAQLRLWKEGTDYYIDAETTVLRLARKHGLTL